MQEHELHAMIRHEKIPPLKAQRLAEALGHDPSRVPVTCQAEGCETERPLGEMFSFISCLATTGPAHPETGVQVPTLQCGDEQHYGCSWECATKALNHCVENHLRPWHAELHQSAKAQIAETADEALELLDRLGSAEAVRQEMRRRRAQAAGEQAGMMMQQQQAAPAKDRGHDGSTDRHE